MEQHLQNLNQKSIHDLLLLESLIISITNELVMFEIDRVKPIVTNPKYFKTDGFRKEYEKLQLMKHEYDAFSNEHFVTEEEQAAIANFNDIYDTYLPKYVDKVRTYIDKLFFKHKDILHIKLVSTMVMLDFLSSVAIYVCTYCMEAYSYVPGINQLQKWRIDKIASMISQMTDFVWELKIKNRISSKYVIVNDKNVIKARQELFQALFNPEKFEQGWKIIQKPIK